MRIRLKKLNQLGFDHVLVLVAFVAIFAIFGIFEIITHAATPTPDIVNGVGGCLTDPGGSTAAEVSMGVASCNGSTAQQWKLTGGKIENTALSGTHCIEPLAGSMKLNAAVVMDTCNTSAHQDWTSGTDGELKNSSSGYCLTIPGGNTAKALTVVTCQPATYSQQRWTASTYSSGGGSTGGGGSGSSGGSGATAGCPQGTKVSAADVAQSKCIASNLMPDYGWSGSTSGSQYKYLVDLWTQESGWNYKAENASGAYGIPQSLPATKMESAGPDYLTNVETQIKWGLGYIKDDYGSPEAAWQHEEADGWYGVTTINGKTEHF